MFARLSSRLTSRLGRRLALGAASGSCVAASVSWCEQGEHPGSYRRFSSSSAERVPERGLLRCRGSEQQMGENYELLEQLGKGGFGTVQKAQQRATGLMRAIK